MARETANVGQPPGRRYVATGRQGCPCQGELRRDGRGLLRLHIGDEIEESSRLFPVLVSQPLAHVHIPLERRTYGHCTPPGHGRLNVRSVSISTLASLRGESSLLCRSSWPISDKVAPDRRSSVARLWRKRWAPWCAKPRMPARSSAVLAIIVIAQPFANPTRGARVRRNNRRHEDLGLPSRR